MQRMCWPAAWSDLSALPKDVCRELGWVCPRKVYGREGGGSPKGPKKGLLKPYTNTFYLLGSSCKQARSNAKHAKALPGTKNYENARKELLCLGKVCSRDFVSSWFPWGVNCCLCMCYAPKLLVHIYPRTNHNHQRAPNSNSYSYES